MRFAFYMEPYRIYHSTFYTYKLLYDIFIQKGHVFDFYTPLDYKIDVIKNNLTKSKKMKINDINQLYNVNFQIGFPVSENYDVLLLESQFYKDWCELNKDMRNVIASKFKLNKKIVIVLSDSMLLETRMIGLDDIIYGTKSARALKLDNKLQHKLSCFFCPPITYLLNPKPNHMTRDGFYEKYGLNPTLKIIAFLPGKLEKWKHQHYKDHKQLFQDEIVNHNFHQNNEQIHWFVKNITKINKYLHNFGYQIVGKMHPRDFNKFLQSENKFNKMLMKEHITYIQQHDTYELIKYSSFSFTFGSTMAYHLYLYNLPTIEIGTGFYFSGWAYPKSTDFHLIKYIKKYNYGKDLIFGRVVNFHEFKNDTEAYIYSLLNNDITSHFKYKYNNPLYGDSYGKGIEEIYNNIAKISTVLYLQKLKNIIDDKMAK